MKLLLKFNLMFVLVFAAGLAATAWIARDLLRANAEAEVVGNARLLMEKAIASRSFTANQIAPLLQAQMQDTFLPSRCRPSWPPKCWANCARPTRSSATRRPR